MSGVASTLGLELSTPAQQVAVAVAVLAVLALVYYWYSKHRKSSFGGFSEAAAEERGAANAALDARRGQRHDGVRQPRRYNGETLSGARYDRLTPSVSAAEMEAAELAAWYEQTPDNAVYNSEAAAEGGSAEVMQYHTGALGHTDYASHITDLVVDPNMRRNHDAWVRDTKPFSAMSASFVDDMDEAVAASLSYQGLRRPQAVAQGRDALFITEADSDLLASQHKKFNFMA